MSSPNNSKGQEAIHGPLVMRWCCYGLLWVGTIYSIASVSVCDFISFKDDDEDTVAKHGLFCFARPKLGSEWMSYDGEPDGEHFADGEYAGRAFGVLAALFLPVALLLFHVAFFVTLPNLSVAKSIWWTIRILVIFSVVFVLLSLSFFHGCVKKPDDTHCTMGAGAALTGINVVLLTVLTALLFWTGPPNLPFRCAGNCWKEREEGAVAVAAAATHDEDDDGEATPVVVQQKPKTGTTTTARTTTTTTSEEEMEDGRLCITTETVDANGNKKIVRKIVRKIVAAKPSHPSSAASATWIEV